MFVGIGLVITAVSGTLLFFPNLRQYFGKIQNRFFGNWYYWLIFLFAIFWTMTAGIITWTDNTRVADASEHNRCTVVEGEVENFVPMPKSGHARETFTVEEVDFAFSDYVITGGYNNTRSHGGSITGGAKVRICYIEGFDASSNLIARLEVAKE
ncbi:hypothetical protein SAMN02745824_0695 [Parasphingorhabdus marina DSM 22363]|uniref:Uncharacterized protein n=2 Tax=Parasphingorhabdus marina TaxID=394732 RepID=A0A1N6CPR5_9SPHN|nr:hypothetical protein SAMN02745824_0695 [Parasphingorhabdus marina DSM 22363]